MSGMIERIKGVVIQELATDENFKRALKKALDIKEDREEVSSYETRDAERTR